MLVAEGGSLSERNLDHFLSGIYRISRPPIVFSFELELRPFRRRLEPYIIYAAKIWF